jgi:hypothetical protein
VTALDEFLNASAPSDRLTVTFRGG